MHLSADIHDILGLAYEADGDARGKAGAGAAELAELFWQGFDTCRVGRYPAPTSPGQLAAYRHSLRIFRKAAQYLDPPLEIIELPFVGETLVGHLQLPPGVTNPPVVMHWGGVDGWKEDRLHVSGLLMKAGLASLAVDMPGSGENPFLYGDDAAEGTYLAWMDHLAQRPGLDARPVHADIDFNDDPQRLSGPPRRLRQLIHIHGIVNRDDHFRSVEQRH